MSDGVALVLPEGNLRVHAHEFDVASVILTGTGRVEQLVVLLHQRNASLGVLPDPVGESVLDDLLFLLRQHGLPLVQHTLGLALGILDGVVDADILFVNLGLDFLFPTSCFLFGSIQIFTPHFFQKIALGALQNFFKLHAHDAFYNCVQCRYTITGLSIALPRMPNIKVAAITITLFFYDSTICPKPGASAAGNIQTIAAVGTEHFTTKQGMRTVRICVLTLLSAAGIP